MGDFDINKILGIKTSDVSKILTDIKPTEPVYVKDTGTLYINGQGYSTAHPEEMAKDYGFKDVKVIDSSNYLSNYLKSGAVVNDLYKTTEVKYSPSKTTKETISKGNNVDFTKYLNDLKKAYSSKVYSNDFVNKMLMNKDFFEKSFKEMYGRNPTFNEKYQWGAYRNLVAQNKMYKDIENSCGVDVAKAFADYNNKMSEISKPIQQPHMTYNPNALHNPNEIIENEKEKLNTFSKLANKLNIINKENNKNVVNEILKGTPTKEIVKKYKYSDFIEDDINSIKEAYKKGDPSLISDNLVDKLSMTKGQIYLTLYPYDKRPSVNRYFIDNGLEELKKSEELSKKLKENEFEQKDVAGKLTDAGYGFVKGLDQWVVEDILGRMGGVKYNLVKNRKLNEYLKKISEMRKKLLGNKNIDVEQTKFNLDTAIDKAYYEYSAKLSKNDKKTATVSGDIFGSLINIAQYDFGALTGSDFAKETLNKNLFTDEILQGKATLRTKPVQVAGEYALTFLGGYAAGKGLAYAKNLGNSLFGKVLDKSIKGTLVGIGAYATYETGKEAYITNEGQPVGDFISQGIVFGYGLEKGIGNKFVVSPTSDTINPGMVKPLSKKTMVPKPPEEDLFKPLSVKKGPLRIYNMKPESVKEIDNDILKNVFNDKNSLLVGKARSEAEYKNGKAIKEITRAIPKDLLKYAKTNKEGKIEGFENIPFVEKEKTTFVDKSGKVLKTDERARFGKINLEDVSSKNGKEYSIYNPDKINNLRNALLDAYKLKHNEKVGELKVKFIEAKGDSFDFGETKGLSTHSTEKTSGVGGEKGTTQYIQKDTMYVSDTIVKPRKEVIDFLNTKLNKNERKVLADKLYNFFKEYIPDEKITKNEILNNLDNYFDRFSRVRYDLLTDNEFENYKNVIETIKEMKGKPLIKYIKDIRSKLRDEKIVPLLDKDKITKRDDILNDFSGNVEKPENNKIVKDLNEDNLNKEINEDNLKIEKIFDKENNKEPIIDENLAKKIRDETPTMKGNGKRTELLLKKMDEKIIKLGDYEEKMFGGPQKKFDRYDKVMFGDLAKRIDEGLSDFVKDVANIDEGKVDVGGVVRFNKGIIDLIKDRFRFGEEKPSQEKPPQQEPQQEPPKIEDTNKNKEENTNKDKGDDNKDKNDDTNKNKEETNPNKDNTNKNKGDSDEKNDKNHKNKEDTKKDTQNKGQEEKPKDTPPEPKEENGDGETPTPNDDTTPFFRPIEPPKIGGIFYNPLGFGKWYPLSKYKPMVSVRYAPSLIGVMLKIKEKEGYSCVSSPFAIRGL